MKPPDSNDDPSLDDLDEIVRAVAHAPPMVSTPRPELVSRRVGTTLRGKYYLEALIGVGGMAAVYKATHRNQAEYAIKMLLPEHAANEELRARFVREGYAANSVKHPGAVRVIDDDLAEDGTAFLVLELLRGLTCEELCSSCGGKLPMDAVCAIGLQALDVLHAAHVNGIIHRDVKPANLFVLRDGSVKVLDFGIARVRETMSTGSYTTGSGVFLGTPAFMAPEQALGKASDVDARADIWAIGATLFAMMSGVTVHEGDSSRALLVRLVTRPTRSLSTVMPEIPKVLADVVDGALAVEREGRWPSAAEMRERLEEAARQEWGELPARRVLASLVAANEPVTSSGPGVASAPAKPKSSPAMAAVTPTLRAQEHRHLPEISLKPSVETTRPVSRERDSIGPRRRFSSFTIVASLSSVAGLVAIAAVFLLGRRGGDAPPMSPQLQGAPADLSTAAPPGVASGSPAPFVALPTDEPAIESAPAEDNVAAPRAGARPLKRRGSPRQDGGSPSAAPPTSRAKSPAVAAPPAQPTPPVQSTQPVAPAAPAASERPAAAPNCNPPFYYDAHFNRVFKKECL